MDKPTRQPVAVRSVDRAPGPAPTAAEPSDGLHRARDGTISKRIRQSSAAHSRETEPETVPDAPPPDYSDPAVGIDTAQEMAARYQPQCVRLYAGVAFGKASRAKLHTRVVAAGNLTRIACGRADEVPEPDGE